LQKKNKGYEEVNEDTKKEKQVDETFENKTKESNEPKNNLMIFLTITTLILFLVLVFLFYLSSKKGRRIKQKKRRQDK
jgi:ATP-dependent Zn protease